jgi:RND family efflux transporter MFP subunit
VKWAKAAIWLLVIAALAAGIWWWKIGRGPEINVATVTRGTAAEIVYGTGSVEPLRWAKVTSVIRDQIVEVCNCEGKAVKKGYVLARLDDKVLLAQLQELKAREDFAKRELARVSTLIERGSATTQSHERASTELRTLRALISVQMEKLDDYTITAPLDGIVLREDAEVGEIAEPGQILYRIGAPKPLRVRAEVNEEDIPKVKIGQKVLFRTDAFPNRQLDGTVAEITPMGDPIAKTYRIFIALPHDAPLKPGMSVEANVIIREQPNVLLVPKAALRGDAVFVVAENRVSRRAVKVGIRGTRAIEILSGLKEDEQVALSPDIALSDGERVRIAKASAAP